MINNKEYQSLFDKHNIDICLGIRASHQIENDIKFFEEYIFRNKRSESIGFIIMPSLEGSIHDRFWRLLHETIRYYRKDSKVLEKLFNIQNLLICLFQEWRKNIQDIKKLDKLIEFDYGVTINDLACGFIGCHSELEDFYENYKIGESK